MVSGNTYFLCISMINFIFQSKSAFLFLKTLYLIRFCFNFYVIKIRLLDLQIFFLCIFDEKMISQWEHHILSIKACDAIRPTLNCFISMIISVA